MTVRQDCDLRSPVKQDSEQEHRSLPKPAVSCGAAAGGLGGGRGSGVTVHGQDICWCLGWNQRLRTCTGTSLSDVSRFCVPFSHSLPHKSLSHPSLTLRVQRTPTPQPPSSLPDQETESRKKAVPVLPSSSSPSSSSSSSWITRSNKTLASRSAPQCLRRPVTVTV